jgi:hypothetical protein
MNPCVILSLFHLLLGPNSLQRHAFGLKFVETFGGRDFVMIDPKSKHTCSQVCCESLWWRGSFAKLGHTGRSPSLPENRAIYFSMVSLSQGSYRQDVSVHANKMAAQWDLQRNSSRPWQELKQLTGLNDIKVEQGHNNFIRIRWLIDQLCNPDERMELKKQVEEVELFHKTDFPNHLERLSEFPCSCSTCGFYNNGTYQ